MPLLQQIYCKDNNTCSLIPLEKRRVAKKILAGAISLVVIILFFTAVMLLPLWLVNVLTSKISKANPIVTFHAGVRVVSTSPTIDIFKIVTPYVVTVFTWLIPICLIIILLSCITQFYYYRNYFYDLGEDGIVIKEGVLSRREITIPYSKIQNVFVDQDALDRAFGLYDVHLETAGFGSHYVSHIDGVNQANSEKLRGLILSKMKKQVSDKDT